MSNPFNYEDADGFINEEVAAKRAELNVIFQPSRELEAMAKHFQNSKLSDNEKAVFAAHIEAMQKELETIKARIYNEAEEIVDRLEKGK